jgi:hypothetical protein
MMAPSIIGNGSGGPSRSWGESSVTLAIPRVSTATVTLLAASSRLENAAVSLTAAPVSLTTLRVSLTATPVSVMVALASVVPDPGEHDGGSREPDGQAGEREGRPREPDDCPGGPTAAPVSLTHATLQLDSRCSPREVAYPTVSPTSRGRARERWRSAERLWRSST